MNVAEKMLKSYTEKINSRLEKLLPIDIDSPLSQAMNYGVMIGGKRLRAVLVLAVCDALNGNREKAEVFASSVEMVHSYSLIFDDLPGMDNDDLRRGKPSNHIVYGEGIAMLAGLGLLAKAFDLYTEAEKNGILSSVEALDGIRILGSAAGLNGIVTGQAMDLENKDNHFISNEKLLKIHSMKTAAMITASVLLGCISANADEKTKQIASDFSYDLGMAFQIRDDVLDVIGTEESMGKTLGKDKAEGKTTFVDMFGLNGAISEAEKYTDLAVNKLSLLPNTDFLVWLTKKLCSRNQ